MKKILIIDDEKHISDLLKFILEKKNYIVKQAFMGLDGLKMAKDERPDLILLDVMMPKMDGYEVGKRLNLAVETKDIPVIMLSSAAQQKDQEKGLKIGAKEYITKPFDKEQLLIIIKQYLKE